MVGKCFFVLISCLIYCYNTPQIRALQTDSTNYACRGRMTIKNVTLTAYYPSDDPNDDSENVDARENSLATLQDFLDENVDYVTMDMDLKIPYGTKICVPELNKHYRRSINLQIRDSTSNVKGQGLRRLDICVRSEADSYDTAVNLNEATVVFKNYQRVN